MLTGTSFLIFILLLFAIAFLYATVGHGGASGYLALMALFGIAPSIMKSSAIILNIFVSLVVFYRYYKSGYFNWKLFLPFALASVPASFIGAYITVDEHLYKKILGALLLFPVLRLIGIFDKSNTTKRPLNIYLAVAVGAVIGLLSGMIGIGGGILLSPVILLIGWGEMKETAAVSALFIFVNSISGLIALISRGAHFDASVYIWVPVALAGGFAGAWFGSKKFSNPVLKKILSAVLLIASVKLLTEPEK